MSHENEGIPAGLVPLGGWQNVPSAPQTVAVPPPVAAPMAAAPATVPLLNPPSAPTSRFAAPPTAVSPIAAAVLAAPVADAPKLAPAPPQRDRAYSLAAAYRRGEVEEMSNGKMIAGIVAGTIVGAIATTSWMILVFMLPWVWQLLFVGGGMGFLVGFTVFKVTGEGEEKSCWISCIISTFFAVGGIITINVLTFPNIWAIAFGIFAIGVASERGYRTPEVLAVETAF